MDEKDFSKDCGIFYNYIGDVIEKNIRYPDTIFVEIERERFASNRTRSECLVGILRSLICKLHRDQVEKMFMGSKYSRRHMLSSMNLHKSLLARYGHRKEDFMGLTINLESEIDSCVKLKNYLSTMVDGLIVEYDIVNKGVYEIPDESCKPNCILCKLF